MAAKSDPRGRLLERAVELAAIERAVELTASGEGGLLVVSGPPGIGKTTLLDAARSCGDDRGLRVLWAGGAELERSFPFGVARQLLEPALLAADDEQREQLLSGAAAVAAPVLGQNGGQGGLSTAPEGDLGTGSPPAATDQLYAPLYGLYWLLVNLAERRPLLLAVDDVHWADPPSLHFLGFLARRLEGLPLLLVLTTREGDPEVEAEPLRSVLAAPRTIVLQPGALGATASRDLLAERMGEEPAVEFASASHEATRGNPYLLAELARELASEGIEPTEHNAARVARLGPRSVSHAVLGRLSNLGPAALSLAKAVAVLGGRTALADAAALARLSREQAVEAPRARAAPHAKADPTSVSPGPLSLTYWL